MESIMKSVHKFQGLQQLRKSKGFTLIELMIVVAIIGILAAIAIPNFLQYQMKSRQSEVKTNLQAIKTSEVSFQAERGCYIGVAAEGSTNTASKATVPLTWAAGAAAAKAGTAWCTATYAGVFNDIGFKATGNVMYEYGVDATAGPAVGYTTVTSCALAVKGTKAAGTGAENNFVAVGISNLDGDANLSYWDSSVDHGSADCTTGIF